ncbi:50S ribosomal protein L11 methyltransferase [Zooshikella harenae]|uniref:50S ribosomal protein L11 methyltransferase n=1 Tax=Zooshikella harenae TaxID=2827238 RepID=A0ABS5ZAV0_9GAMM|nr:50S ribosomal protein L11 methyltransferase [Zooshikella harenae]MBU2711155.1 50S ribosomal protein L11 methyltransferase [Zooshikella harenae]
MRIPENVSQETYCQLWLAANQQRFTTNYTAANIPIIVYQQVFCPSTELTHSTSFLLSKLPDLSKKVIACDIDPVAIANCKENIARHQLDSINVFEALPANDKLFDVIIANLPILESGWDYVVTDIKKLYDDFLNQVYFYLTHNGQCYFSFASFGNHQVLSALDASPLTWHMHQAHRFGCYWQVFETTKA